jgi:hypothetical protein
MKQYAEIDNDIDALITQNDVLCAIDVVSISEKNGITELDLDWYMQLKSRADAGPVTRRRERIHAELTKVRNKWKIARLEPSEILKP